MSRAPDEAPAGAAADEARRFDRIEAGVLVESIVAGIAALLVRFA